MVCKYNTMLTQITLVGCIETYKLHPLERRHKSHVDVSSFEGSRKPEEQVKPKRLPRQPHHLQWLPHLIHHQKMTQ